MTDAAPRAFKLTANHVGVGVSSLERSLAFYRDLLGFNVAYERGEVTAEYMPRLVGIPGARLKIAGPPQPTTSHEAAGADRLVLLRPDRCLRRCAASLMGSRTTMCFVLLVVRNYSSTSVTS